jgi:2-haloalkanoic acid dehalogenase type II
MRESLERHLSNHIQNFQETAYIWGHETHNIFMDLREKKDFKSAREINLSALKKVLQNMGVSATNAQVQTIVEDVWRGFVKQSTMYPDTIPTLKKLQRAGYRLGIITDCDSDIAEGILQKHNLTPFFDVTIISGTIKAYKPNTIMFTEALSEVQCNPSQGVYVGDSEVDIKGAKKVGMTTIMVERDAPENCAIGIKPDYVIDTLGNLPKLIFQLEGSEHVDTHI